MSFKKYISLSILLMGIMWCVHAHAQEVALTQQDVDSTLALVKDKKWAGLIGVLIFWAMRFVKTDIKPEWLNVRPRLRILVVWVLSIASMVADKIGEGISWPTALMNMAISLVISVVILHQTFIASYRAGKELPVPYLTIPGMRPSPTAPATITPPNPAPVVIPGTGSGEAIDASLQKQEAQAEAAIPKDPV
jgi:predicted lipid-binding transport protein (Tim44 family)